MNIPKTICLVLTLFSLIVGAMGPLPGSEIRDPVAFRFVYFSLALASAGVYYGIMKKLPAGWKLGWVIAIGVPLIVYLAPLHGLTLGKN